MVRVRQYRSEMVRVLVLRLDMMPFHIMELRGRTNRFRIKKSDFPWAYRQMSIPNDSVTSSDVCVTDSEVR